MHTSIRISAALVAALSVASSQEPVRPVSSAAQVLRTPTPIHTQADDPIGGAYGVWTAGPTWKASFHDGFRFYAYATDLHEHPRLGWNTESLAIGGETLLLGEGRASWTADRHVTEYASLREVYEVRADGVEQRFVIDLRPKQAGELVVTGRVDTNLRAESTTPRVGALSFRLGGDERIRYGEALAFDAAGNRVPVATSFDGERIRLHVPADFVASAVYPLTIDPLTTAQHFAGSNAPILAMTFTGSSFPGSTTAITGFIVQTSATDQDLVAYTCTEIGGFGLFAFQDVTNSWSTRTIDSTEVAAANRWVFAFERFFPSSSTTGARAQVLDIAFNPANPGTTLFAATGTSKPRIGGRRNGTDALLVFGSGGGSTAQLVDVAGPALQSTLTISTDADNWSVSRAASGSSAWCVLSSNSTLGVVAYLISAGASAPIFGALTSVSAPIGAGSPQVDGDNGRFLVTWTETSVPTSQRRLRAQRFDYNGTAFTLGTVRSVSSVSILTSLTNGEIAYDFTTQSHWAVTWATSSALSMARSARIARLGYQGGVVESQELYATTQTVDAIDPFVCFNGNLLIGTRPSFSCGYTAYTQAIAGYEAFHRTFNYAPDAIASTYGSSCSNAVLGDGHPPFAGSQFYNVSAQGLPANSGAWISIGVGPTNLPLDIIGMTGCVMLTDPIVTLSTRINGSGLAILYIPLNDAPVFLGDFYLQWLWLDAAANTLGVVNSRGMHVQVR
ncbi:MAG: hypothetical protein HZB39_06340 [Planctomycetes bacterium]|nr:hypothetical protein [Planctomycetota bacterium]